MRFAICIAVLIIGFPAHAQQLPGTKPLTMKGDLAAKMVAGIDRYLMREIEAAAKQRQRYWRYDFTSPAAYETSIEINRRRFRKIIGVADKRLPSRLEYVSTPLQPALVAETKKFKVHAVRWDVLPGMQAEGLLLTPVGEIRARVVAVPDADTAPEVYAGIKLPGVKYEPQHAFARRLAENHVMVLIPTLIDRKDTWSGNPDINRLTNQPHREFVYRMSYEMGRHVIGYEVQKVLAAIDWFERQQNPRAIGVVGYGEGGLIAFYAGASDKRIGAVGVSGYFGVRDSAWKEPIYRNVWSLLREFGETGVASLIAPRRLIIEDHAGPKIEGPPQPSAGRRGAAPGSTLHFETDHQRAVTEVKWLRKNIYDKFKLKTIMPHLQLFDARDSAPHTKEFLKGYLMALTAPLAANGDDLQPLEDNRRGFNPVERQKRQFDEAVAFTQSLLPTAVHRRDEFWKKIETTSLEKWRKSTQYYRDYFHDEVIGRLPKSTMPMNARTRLIYQTKKWKGYEVVLDLYEDVICYGILLVPNDLQPGEKRPVVVCQHGLEGRPTDVCNPKERTRAYNSFGAQLADLGYIVFAPQAPYIGRDDFRVLVRKGNPLKLSLYSFIVQQHERILDWLETLPFVDARRIAYYGLSYGGKVAMRIGALVERYCVVICSGDFNEWIWKNINLVWRGSYMFTIEYEMYEFDLGDTFNYAEMARLIAPRPFMVERGHKDGVGLDEWVAHEFARVRHLYARLNLADRTEIEYFQGGHEIHGQGTFRFLRRYLKGKRK